MGRELKQEYSGHVVPHRVQWLSAGELVEVLKGVIAPIDAGARLFHIEAETSAGKRLFQAFEPRSSVDLQSDYVSDLDVFSSVRGWGKSVASDAGGQVLVYGNRVRSPKRAGARARVLVERGKESSRDVLYRLRKPHGSQKDLRRAVLDAEVVLFTPSEVEEVCELLKKFILRFRGSSSKEDLIAVGSAIRKYVVYLPANDLGFVVQLLEVGPWGAASLEVELEASKAILRKLKKSPLPKSDAEPALADLLADIATTYLNARLLARDKYGATALNAVLALGLLRSSLLDRIGSKIEDADQAWFSKLLERQAAMICDGLSAQFAGDLLKEYCSGLYLLINYARKAT